MSNLVRDMSRKLEMFFRDRSPVINAKIVGGKTNRAVTYLDIKLGKKDNFAKINRLVKDIGLVLRSPSTPLIYTVGEKGVVRIEVPKQNNNLVRFNGQLISEPLQVHLGLGRDNNDIMLDIKECPHLLIAGSTQSGKSVAEHNIIVSALSQRHLVDVYLIDPKRVEFTIYKDKVPVFNTAEDATKLLNKMVDVLNIRLNKMEESKVRNISEFNRKNHNDLMKYKLVVIDELADLMSDKMFSNALGELAQKSRAVGIHLIVATQRPSTDIINGVIKANFPARIGLRVPTGTDSRVILDENGAEKLLGKGDSLLKSPDNFGTLRFKGAFQSIDDIVRFLINIPAQKEDPITSINNKDNIEIQSICPPVYNIFNIATTIRDYFPFKNKYKNNQPIDLNKFPLFKNFNSDEILKIINSLEGMGFLKKDKPNLNGDIIKHYYIISNGI